MNKYLLAGATIAALVTASPAFADSHGPRGGDDLVQIGGVQVHVDGDMETQAEHDGTTTATVSASTSEDRGLGAEVRLLAHEQDNALHGIGDLVSALAHRLHRDLEHGTTTATSSATVNVNITGTVSAINGTTLTVSGKNGATYTVNAAQATVRGGTFADIKIGDTVAVRGTLNGSIIDATTIRDTSLMRDILSTIDSVRAGVVTALTSTGFTLNPFGSTGTTSVTTNASTTFVAGNKATTSSAVATGTNVLAFGTTSTSTPNSFVASIIVILGQGLAFLKDLMMAH